MAAEKSIQMKVRIEVTPALSSSIHDFLESWYWNRDFLSPSEVVAELARLVLTEGDFRLEKLTGRGEHEQSPERAP